MPEAVNVSRIRSRSWLPMDAPSPVVPNSVTLAQPEIEAPLRLGDHDLSGNGAAAFKKASPMRPTNQTPSPIYLLNVSEK